MRYAQLALILFAGYFLFDNCTRSEKSTEANEVRLIVRGDDIGSCHAANIACIKSYTDGIQKTVEVMVPCPWFLEAAEMLRAQPGLDVGVHLTLTSEWDNYKWCPLTCAPSLVDSNGYFLPKQKDWNNENATNAFWNAKPDMKEVEQELRAQIEMALKHIPQVSHVTGHMGIESVDPQMKELIDRLKKEYRLNIELEAYDVKYARDDYSKEKANAQKQNKNREKEFIQMLENLEPGTYLYVEHPGLNTPEMQAIGHLGYENVATDRVEVTKIFTSKKVKASIKRRRIKLMSYFDLKKEKSG